MGHIDTEKDKLLALLKAITELENIRAVEAKRIQLEMDIKNTIREFNADINPNTHPSVTIDGVIYYRIIDEYISVIPDTKRLRDINHYCYKNNPAILYDTEDSKPLVPIECCRHHEDYWTYNDEYDTCEVNYESRLTMYAKYLLQQPSTTNCYYKLIALGLYKDENMSPMEAMYLI